MMPSEKSLIQLGENEQVEIPKEDARLFEKLSSDRRAKLAMGTTEEYLRMLEKMKELEKKGEIIVHHVEEDYKPAIVKTLSNRDKKIPTEELWQHKSCGQCGHIPGYISALYWIMSELSKAQTLSSIEQIYNQGYGRTDHMIYAATTLL